MKENGAVNNGNTLIPANGHYQARFVVSRVISSLDDIEHTIDNAVEILGYDNFADRRMSFVNDTGEATIDGLGIDTFMNYTVYLDENHDDINDITDTLTARTYTRHSEFPGNTRGIDFNKASNAVMVVPPTGVQINKDEIKSIVVLVISVSIIAIGFISNVFNKKKINN